MSGLRATCGCSDPRCDGHLGATCPRVPLFTLVKVDDDDEERRMCAPCARRAQASGQWVDEEDADEQ